VSSDAISSRITSRRRAALPGPWVRGVRGAGLACASHAPQALHPLHRGADRLLHHAPLQLLTDSVVQVVIQSQQLGFQARCAIGLGREVLELVQLAFQLFGLGLHALAVGELSVQRLANERQPQRLFGCGRQPALQGILPCDMLLQRFGVGLGGTSAQQLGLGRASRGLGQGCVRGGLSVLELQLLESRQPTARPIRGLRGGSVGGSRALALRQGRLRLGQPVGTLLESRNLCLQRRLAEALCARLSSGVAQDGREFSCLPLVFGRDIGRLEHCQEPRLQLLLLCLKPRHLFARALARVHPAGSAFAARAQRVSALLREREGLAHLLSCSWEARQTEERREFVFSNRGLIGQPGQAGRYGKGERGFEQV